MLAEHGRNIGPSTENLVERDEQLACSGMFQHIAQGACAKGLLDISRVGVHRQKEQFR